MVLFQKLVGRVIIQENKMAQFTNTDTQGTCFYGEETGTHECLLSEGGEGNLQSDYFLCEKNPGHKEFTPVKSFRLENLPELYRDPGLYEYVKAVAELTVRLEVTVTSPHRPEFYPGTQVPFPFYDLRGKKTMRYGSGQINVFKYENGNGCDCRGSALDIFGDIYKKICKTCPCKKCQSSEVPSTIWWEIVVHTAAHVVFDDVEASENTNCKLFYDEQDSDVFIIDDLRVSEINLMEDVCLLQYSTCDESIGKKLFQKNEHLWNVWMMSLALYTTRADDKLCFIVSHPHGSTKQVSFGRWVDKVTVEFERVFREDQNHLLHKHVPRE
ncbi:hypothetical protein BgiBS90_033013 [Biomphalaria glabrata]|nr:hypothetical protein BgiBS90_033013 [Biomphalaria glabrata]